LINNRQGGRRRGRGGQRPQGMPGRNEGNRQDNRQRGNAAQLLEKYKAMARDAQLAGDRVQTEYYLQFADHYFRVLGESRVRFEEQRRGDGDSDDDSSDGEELMEEADGGSHGNEQGYSRGDDGEGAERPQRRRGRDRDERFEGRERPQRRERANGNAPESRDDGETDERIAFEVLPPAIGAADDGEAEDRPQRRRTRRPRAEDGSEEIAPAA